MKLLQLPLLLVFLQMIAVAVGVPQTQATNCPAEWTAFGNSCYYFPAVELMYGGCKEYCTVHGNNSKMLCIEDSAQDAFISSRAKGWTHIDITDVSQEGNWVWGAGCSANYTHWREYEPGGGRSENYATLATDGGWEDVDNQHTYFCACQSTQVPTDTPTSAPTTFPTTSPTTTPTTTPASPPPTTCPEGWKVFQDKCYLIPDEVMIYADCKAYCPAQHSHASMLCIENVAQETFLAQNVLGWTNIDFTDLAHEGSFEWGGTCNSSYTHWRDGVPGGDATQNCATMLDAQGWLNTDCPVWKYYCACEVPIAVPAPPLPLPTTCPEGWKAFQDKCYLIPDEVMIYADCKAYCPAQNSHASMLCIENAAEEVFLAQNVIGWTNIGYTDLANEGDFVWRAGCLSTYHHWRDETPSNGYGANCVTMLDAQGWLNTDCPVWKYYCACEIDTKPAHAVLVPTVAPSRAPNGCPDGWRRFQGKCYFTPNEVMIYADCKAFCPAQNADATMLCVENAAQEAYLGKNLRGWTNIDFTDLAHEGSFEWGSTCNSSYAHWRDGVPGGDATQNCATMLDAQGWLNTDCPVWKYYCACEMPVTPRVPNFAPTPEPSRRTIYLTHRPISDPALAPTAEPTADAPVHLFDVVQDVDDVDYDVYLANQEMYDLVFQETILLAMGDLAGVVVSNLVVSAGQRRFQQLRHEDPVRVLATTGVHLQYGVYSVDGVQEADVVAAALVLAVQTGAFDDLLRAQGVEAGVSGLTAASSRHIETKDPPTTVDGEGTEEGTGGAWDRTMTLAIVAGIAGVLLTLVVVFFVYYCRSRSQVVIPAAKYAAESTLECVPVKADRKSTEAEGQSDLTRWAGM